MRLFFKKKLRVPLFLFHMRIMIDWEVSGIWIIPVPLAICTFWEASLYYWWLASFSSFYKHLLSIRTYMVKHFEKWNVTLLTPNNIYTFIFNLMFCPSSGFYQNWVSFACMSPYIGSLGELITSASYLQRVFESNITIFLNLGSLMSLPL